jgi:hypothetical protein
MDEIDSFEEFFPNNSLKDSKFYFYCPNMTEEDKTLIINLIKEKRGVRFTNIFIIFSCLANIIKIIKEHYNYCRRKKSIKITQIFKIN